MMYYTYKYYRYKTSRTVTAPVTL